MDLISTTTIISSVVVFLTVIITLVSILLFTKSKLTPAGKLKLIINGEKELEVEGGNTVLTTLSDAVFFYHLLVVVVELVFSVLVKFIKEEEILPTEKPHFSRKQIADNFRLGCQVKVKEDMEIEIPEEVFGVKEWEATVVSNYNVATYIKKFIVEIPEDMDYKAGGYIQIKVPAGEVKYSDMDIKAHPQDHPGEPDKFEEDWSKGSFAMRHLVMKNDDEIVRAYSMASFPAEGRKVMLNVRVLAPPWDREKNKWADINPGIASSYIFGLKEGDKVTISGHYGEFFINDSEAEMLYIGGGAGMAPMRSHLYELFKTIKTGRKVTFFYGGRSRAELFYIHYFRDLEKDFPNFKFHLVLSDAKPEDNWIEEERFK